MIKILADSTCDLSKDLIEKYQIGIIPLYVHLGEDEYKDGVDISPEEIFAWSDKNDLTPKTAAPSVADFEEFFDKDGEDEYIVFTISSEFSSSFSNCMLAIDDMEIYERAYVIDSANLSTGIGLLIIYAAELAAQGMKAEDIVNTIKETREKVRASFIVDTLTYLYRGGRCSGVAALFGSALKIHPKILVENGAMRPDKKYRGKNIKFVMDYVKDLEDELKTARKERVFITHSGCDKTIVDSVRKYLEDLNQFDEIIETRAGAVISSHCGPGTLGVLFISQ
ncbi:MAG: DegV family protein [Pseudobutyrivibrio sp.]|nr:DegV family protein [Pseudobutyrivibrio sp.]